MIRAYSVSIFDTVFSETGNTTMFSEHTSDNVTMGPPGAGCQHTSSMAYIAAIVIGVCRLFSSLTLARILMTCSRRTMYFSSLVLTILSLLMFSTFSFMMKEGPVFSLQVGSFLSSCVLVISVQVVQSLLASLID